jgi:hypothetical protein
LAGLPEGLTKEFVKAGASSLISGSDIGTALMAGSIGAAGSLSQQIGDRIGSSIKDVAKNIFSKKEISEEETLLIIQYGQELEGTKSAHRWGKAEFERQSPEMRTKAYNTNKKIIKAYEKIEADIEKLIVEEAKLQLPNANEEKLRQIVSNQLHKYQSPRDRMKFIESLPKEFKLKANQYLSSQESNGYQKTALPLVIGAYEAALFITGLAYIGANCYQDWRRNNTGFQIEKDFDEDAYKKPDLSLEEKLTRSTNGYQVEDPYGGRLRNPTPGFMPMFNGKKDLIMEKNKHKSGSADKNRKDNTEKGMPESILGPSGKPKIHVTDHSTKKRANDVSIQHGKRGEAPEHHPNPTKGKPHFHPSGSNSNEHHTYPGKGFPRNQKY